MNSQAVLSVKQTCFREWQGCGLCIDLVDVDIPGISTEQTQFQSL